MLSGFTFKSQFIEKNCTKVIVAHVVLAFSLFYDSKGL